jgi:hypothetical protein
MPFITVNDVAEVKLSSLMLGHNNLNTMYVDLNGTAASWTISMLTFLADYFEAWLTNTVAPLLSDDLSYRTIECTSLESANAPFVLRQLDPAIPGGINGTPVGNQRVLCVSFRTDLRGRNYRGRNYLSGIVESNLANPNNVTTVHAAAWVTAFEAIQNTLATEEGWTQCVVSRFLNKQPRAVGLATDVTTYTVNTQLDTQRRRMKDSV